VRLGTRKSELAMVQARAVAALLAPREVELCPMSTEGDRRLDASLAGTLDKGWFTAEIDRALLDGRIDIAVHSLKDLPVAVDPAIHVVLPVRASAADLLLVPAAREIPPDDAPPLRPGARIGSSSGRRAALLRAYFPGVAPVPLRGNVPTRLLRVADGSVDGAVVAEAGLARLGMTAAALLDRGVRAWRLDPRAWPGAPGQGALALACRAGDARARAALAPLDHAPTRMAVTAERALLAQLGSGCSVPFGAFVDGEAWSLALARGQGTVLQRGRGDASAALAALAAGADGISLPAQPWEPWR
jgi:hydroxymethylbilane synthase